MADEQINSNEITLAEICKEMGIKPQGARVKLRKKLAAEEKGEGFRWVFPIERKDEIIALLTPAEKAEVDPEAEPKPKKARKSKKAAAEAEVEEDNDE